MNLEGKRVVVTGGSSGIGLATAQATVAVGAKVFITGRRRDIVTKAVDQLRATGSEASGVVADVAANDGRAATLHSAL
jgi:NAD(P)-dependent dehydrogenase (short-subunit alcohol dehydrogenase family)